MDKLNILVLEDDRERHASFMKNMGNENLVIVETVKDTIDKLSNDKWDFLFLDHDLGGKIFVESGPGTGYEVACWLEEHTEFLPKVVIIHSLNQVGANKMRLALKDSYLIPGAWIFTDFIDNWEKVSCFLDKTDRTLKVN